MQVNCCPLNGDFFFSIPFSHALYAFPCTPKVPLFQVACSALDYSRITSSKCRLQPCACSPSHLDLLKGKIFWKCGRVTLLVHVDGAEREMQLLQSPPGCIDEQGIGCNPPFSIRKTISKLSHVLPWSNSV